jgi:SAM-dependent methyltransferase
MQHTPEYFESLFDENDDPWQFRSRWYEQRKRALTLACLPATRYASAYEPGCANGELSATLASRCDELLVSDGSAKAVALARARLAALPHVQVRQAWLPSQWPAQDFDLIVVSELGYFLGVDGLDALAPRMLASLRPDATVLACHWRRNIEGCELDGDGVHRRLGDRLSMPHVCALVDDDLRLDVWCNDPRSVAQREGFDF